MGLALRLLPFDGDCHDVVYSHTVLSCAASRALFAAVQALPTWPVPPRFVAFCAVQDGREGYGICVTTPYGEPLTYALAGALAPLVTHPDVEDSETNRAIWAYLGCLDLQTKVALFWH